MKAIPFAIRLPGRSATSPACPLEKDIGWPVVL